ncbi:MAG TPA: hypothetical protein VK658_28270 [Chryseolinea sp.]|nr:hypothetical protein [Chryseolinea sp.]
MEKIRVVLTNGTHRDFDLERVFTTSDINSLLNNVLIFIKLHGENRNHKIHSWYPVNGNEVFDSKPA